MVKVLNTGIVLPDLPNPTLPTYLPNLSNKTDTENDDISFYNEQGSNSNISKHL